MKYLVILSGGVGTRMNNERPKQYIEIENKPIIAYTLDQFDLFLFESVILVVAENWKEYIKNNVLNKYRYSKFGFAGAGDSRQESILNGLKTIKNINEEDLVFIHDAARPCVSKKLVDNMISISADYDGVMPVLPVKDTIYISKNGREISGLLQRDELFAGQSPELFKLATYLAINNKLTKEELSNVRGSSEVAYKYNMKIGLIEGDEKNFKITTPADLERFKEILITEKR